VNDAPNCVNSEQQSDNANSPKHRAILRQNRLRGLDAKAHKQRIWPVFADVNSVICSQSRNRFSYIALLMNGTSALIGVARFE
jgi:hypothetical protein